MWLNSGIVTGLFSLDEEMNNLELDKCIDSLNRKI
jgi:hypothetical protein